MAELSRGDGGVHVHFGTSTGGLHKEVFLLLTLYLGYRVKMKIIYEDDVALVVKGKILDIIYELTKGS